MFDKLIPLYKLLIVPCAITILIFAHTPYAKETFDLGKHIKEMFVGEDLDPKYGNYQDIVLPVTFFSGDQKYTNMRKQAVQKVIYRFISKQSTLSKYPGKAIEGLVWLEMLYNEMIKHPKATRPSAIRDLWQAREDIRMSMGFHNLESTQEVVDRYILLSSLLANATVTEQAIDPNLKKRKDIYKNLKSNISRAKKNYLGELDDTELALLEKKSIKHTDITASGIATSAEETGPSDDHEGLSSGQTLIEKQLADLKSLYEKGLITEEVYKTKQLEILDSREK